MDLVRGKPTSRIRMNSKLAVGTADSQAERLTIHRRLSFQVRPAAESEQNKGARELLGHRVVRLV